MLPAASPGRVVLVPFVAFRCPHCGARKPRTYGQRGRMRWHRCLACDRRYRSLELEPADLARPEALRGLSVAPTPRGRRLTMCEDPDTITAAEFGELLAVPAAVVARHPRALTGFGLEHEHDDHGPTWPRRSVEEFLAVRGAAKEAREVLAEADRCERAGAVEQAAGALIQQAGGRAFRESAGARAPFRRDSARNKTT